MAAQSAVNIIAYHVAGGRLHFAFKALGNVYARLIGGRIVVKRYAGNIFANPVTIPLRIKQRNILARAVLGVKFTVVHPEPYFVSIVVTLENLGIVNKTRDDYFQSVIGYLDVIKRCGVAVNIDVLYIVTVYTDGEVIGFQRVFIVYRRYRDYNIVSINNRLVWIVGIFGFRLCDSEAGVTSIFTAVYSCDIYHRLDRQFACCRLAGTSAVSIKIVAVSQIHFLAEYVIKIQTSKTVSQSCQITVFWVGHIKKRDAVV